VLTVRYGTWGLQPGELVLDAGAGFGRHAFETARRGARVVVLDYALDEVVSTRNTFAAMAETGEITGDCFGGVVRGDATRLPFADSSFDRVVTSEVLEHIQDDVAAIRELVRVLRNGGVLAVTVPSWFPEKINWMLSDEYHAPKSVGGHVRIYSATELRAKLEAAGLELYASHHAHALHSPYWWLRCAVGPSNDEHWAVNRYRRFLEWDIVNQPRSIRLLERTLDPVLGKSLVPEGCRMTLTRGSLPHLPGIITADEVRSTARAIAGLQLPNGMIPWFDGGHCDPWNHVETAMALDVAGMHDEAALAYEWLMHTQRPDGAWHNYYLPDATLEDAKLDTNVCAYIGTGLWHHFLCTGDRAFAERSWTVLERALDWVLALQFPHGPVLWAIESDGRRPWDYALLTGSSSICHAVECAIRLGNALGRDVSAWTASTQQLASAIRAEPGPPRFADKSEWAMDWYYPVLCGVMSGEDAKVRLADQWDRFVMAGRGVRCVSSEPWVTAAETAECSLAHMAIGDVDIALDLLATTRAHRCDDGSYLTGLVYPQRITFPDQERTAYTAAAVILAADSITGASPASAVFHNPSQHA
jgi:SAM-dependent methyltransferase